MNEIGSSSPSTINAAVRMSFGLIPGKRPPRLGRESAVIVAMEF
jgi:hypothetical protein